MKIHYPRSVRVVRHRTPKEALEACYGRRELYLKKYLGETLSELLDRALWRNSDGDERIYERVLAFVEIEREVKVAEFLMFIQSEGYEVASLSEGLALTRELIQQDVAPGNVFHLGAVLRDEEYLEYRLITSREGVPRLVRYFTGVTVLRPPSVLVVALRKEVL